MHEDRSTPLESYVPYYSVFMRVSDGDTEPQGHDEASSEDVVWRQHPDGSRQYQNAPTQWSHCVAPTPTASSAGPGNLNVEYDVSILSAFEREQLVGDLVLQDIPCQWDPTGMVLCVDRQYEVTVDSLLDATGKWRPRLESPEATRSEPAGALPPPRPAFQFPGNPPPRIDPPDPGPRVATIWHSTRWNLIGAAVASVLVCFGSFMAWVTVSILGISRSEAGISGDGQLVLVFGTIAVVLALVALRQDRRGFSMGGVVFSIFTLLVAADDSINLEHLIGQVNSSVVASGLASVSIGPGLVLVLIGSAAATLTFARVAFDKATG